MDVAGRERLPGVSLLAAIAGGAFLTANLTRVLRPMGRVFLADLHQKLRFALCVRALQFHVPVILLFMESARLRRKRCPALFANSGWFLNLGDLVQFSGTVVLKQLLDGESPGERMSAAGRGCLSGMSCWASSCRIAGKYYACDLIHPAKSQR